MPGNHDTLITAKALKNIVPGITCNIKSPGLGTFTADGIIAEHGSKYCLFNAPDTYDNPGHSLPLGYFITRVVAEAFYQTGKQSNSREVLADAIWKLLHSEDFAKAVFGSIAKSSGMKGSDSILMQGINGYKGNIKVSSVEKLFENLFDEWDGKMKKNVPATEAVIDDTGHLYPAAFTQYFMKKNKPDIVIFGHTHIYDIHGFEFSFETLEKMAEAMFTLKFKKAIKILEGLDKGGAVPYDHIYANSGTWVSQKPKSTFVETEITTVEKQKRHYVRVNQYVNSKNVVKTLEERYKVL